MPCLSESAIAAFVAGGADASDQEAVLAHIDDCDTCRSVVALCTRATVRDEDAHRQAETLSTGEAVSQYRILGILGAGAMGVVYSAYDPRLDRKVALKVLRDGGPEGGPGADGRNERLQREARAMAKLSHPNVVAVHDVGMIHRHVFFAMEFVDGLSGAEWIEAAPRSWREVVDVFVQAGRGLAAAHAAGIVVRDFKPDNLLVGFDGRVRITDFGLARAIASVGAHSPSSSSVANAKESSIAGTPAYMAPEQRRGERADVRSDQYSFAMAMFEALERAESAGSLPPVYVRRALAKALSVDPAARFSSMDTLLEALDARAGRSSSRLRPVPLLVTTAAMAAIVGTGWSLLHRADARDSSAATSHAQEASVAYESAFQAWKDGSSALARRTLERALALDPGLASARLRLALWNEDEADAREHVREALAQRGSLGELDRALLLACEPRFRQLPDFAEWEARLQSVAERFPGAAEVHHWIGQARAQRSDRDGALRAFERARTLDPDMAPIGYAAIGLLERPRPQEAAAAYEACLRRAPASTDCLGGRIRLRGLAGDCSGMEQDAHAWIAADASDPDAYDALSAALFATKAPRDAVIDALRARIERMPTERRDAARLLDRYALAMADGDFDDAKRAMRSLEDATSTGPGTTTAHFVTLLNLAIAARESGQADVAIGASNEFLSRARAWTPETPREVAMPLFFVGYAYHQGGTTRAEYVAERSKWLTLGDAAWDRSGRPKADNDRNFLWIAAYAATSQTPELAKEALAALPEYLPLQPPGSRDVATDLVIGNTYSLGGMLDESLPYLRAAIRNCSLRAVYGQQRARLRLGAVLEARGEADEARGQYEAIVAQWRGARARSTTVEAARARLGVR